jgi:hypothetical protein
VSIRFRFRPVADAFGAPVLRDQGLDRSAGHGKAAVAVGRRLRLSTGTLLNEKAGKPHNAGVTDPDAIDDGAGAVRPCPSLPVGLDAG